MSYGNRITRSVYVPVRDVIDEPSISPAGNLILPIGREIKSSRGGWAKIAHVVMEPDEARAFLAACAAELDAAEAA
jgi:hypothetical protein